MGPAEGLLYPECVTAPVKSRVVASLDKARESLGRIPLDEAQKIRRRILHDEPDVPKTGVSAFGSFI